MMAKQEQIQKFANCWLDRFQNAVQGEMTFSVNNMTEACIFMGFQEKCGRAFVNGYGENLYEVTELKKIIGHITDIMLLGSVILTRSLYFHECGDDREIIAPENRTWFVLAFRRLAELAEITGQVKNAVILSPEVEKYKETIQKLRTELSMLFFRRDELKYVECPNIEMQYMHAIGGLEIKVYELYCESMRLKRGIEIIQAMKNHQESISIPKMQEILDSEFAEYQEKMNEQVARMNAALERNKGEYLSEEETKETKKRYRAIMKALHPDLHPDLTPEQLELFHHAVEAFEHGDLRAIQAIYDMITDQTTSVLDEENNSIQQLKEEQGRLTAMLHTVQQKIRKIKENYPYNLRLMINDKNAIAAKKADLKYTFEVLKKRIEIYQTRL